MPEYPSGPFRQVDNRWSFVEAAGGCDVQFYISYDFKSLMMQMLVGSLFDRVFRRYTQAFEERARVVYGLPSRHRTRYVARSSRPEVSRAQPNATSSPRRRGPMQPSTIKHRKNSVALSPATCRTG